MPGFMGNPDSLDEESHHTSADGGLLEYPVYTKPPSWRGLDVPDVLLSGHHAEIARWRRDQSLRRTAERRPDLLAAAEPGLVGARPAGAGGRGLTRAGRGLASSSANFAPSAIAARGADGGSAEWGEILALCSEVAGVAGRRERARFSGAGAAIFARCLACGTLVRWHLTDPAAAGARVSQIG